MGFFKKLFSKKDKEKLDDGLQKTKEGVWNRISHAVAGKNKIDEDVLDNLEEAFIMSDVGVDTTLDIIDRIKDRVSKDKYVGLNELSTLLCEEITDMIDHNQEVEEDPFSIEGKGKPYVIMVVGVNGAGKTTTIGKLAHLYKEAGNKVIIGAADTFRAASIEQVEFWADKAGVPLVKQKMGSDPAAVAYDTVSSAKAQNADVVIIDTAGRLHNKVGLMNELTKIKNVMRKVVPEAPQEILLVLDGSTGQNAFEQAKEFISAADVNTLAITKLDGSAKGGVVIGISDRFKVPVKYIGIGEGISDLQVFDAPEFVKSLFGNAVKGF